MKSILLAVLLFSVTPSRAQSQQPGKFDYYLLTLSWSPEFCYSHPTSPECAKHLGLIVHGLWPQYNGANAGPEHCGHPPGPANPNALLDIMPSASLVEHEWAAHGSCSGLNANDYFALLRRVFSRFHAPPQLQHPARQAILRVADLKRAIAQANPGLHESEMALACRGRYLSEVELCLGKDGKPQPCAALRECGGPSVFVPAFR